MKRRISVQTLSLLLLPFVGFIALQTFEQSPFTHAQSNDGDSQSEVVAVESDMHEFMEYVFEPPFKRLKATMAVATKENSQWKSIKSDSLILAECCNLLLTRAEEADQSDWQKHSSLARTFGGQLYQAAKKKDEAESQKAYRLMLDNCNNCHTQFADGEHQLEP